jgi:hypothetical protein
MPPNELYGRNHGPGGVSYSLRLYWVLHKSAYIAEYIQELEGQDLKEQIGLGRTPPLPSTEAYESEENWASALRMEQDVTESQTVYSHRFQVAFAYIHQN